MATNAKQAGDCASTTDAGVPFSSIFQSDLWWTPYRAAARMGNQAERNLALMVHANRKLADTIREIGRREQDILLGLSEKMMRELTKGAEPSEGKASSAPFEAYLAAMAGAREIGQAVADAQAESLEALREYSQSAMEAGLKLGQEFRTAA